jgi:hypothetical protein
VAAILAVPIEPDPLAAMLTCPLAVDGGVHARNVGRPERAWLDLS